MSVHENAVNVGGRIVVETPKSHASRSLPFPEFLSEPLTRLCEGKERDALLFGNGTEYLRSPDVRDGWYVSAVRKRRRSIRRSPRSPCTTYATRQRRSQSVPALT